MIPTLRRIQKDLEIIHPIPATPKNIKKAGRLFRQHWMHDMEGEDRVPRALSGGCLFGSAVAYALFRGEICANWQHAWNLHDDTIIDLTGLHDVPVDRAINIHIAMLRKRGYTVAKDDAKYMVTRGSFRDGYVHEYPPLEPETFFVSDPKHTRGLDFRDCLDSVAPRSLGWARSIREELAST